jgi:hypothetical protein
MSQAGGRELFLNRKQTNIPQGFAAQPGWNLLFKKWAKGYNDFERVWPCPFQKALSETGSW